MGSPARARSSTRSPPDPVVREEPGEAGPAPCGRTCDRMRWASCDWCGDARGSSPDVPPIRPQLARPVVRTCCDGMTSVRSR